MINCKNCGDTVQKNYCPECGQKIEGRLTFRSALDDMVRGITNGDKGVVLTLRELFTRPGKMIVEYIDGRRAIHFRPFPLLILITGLIMLFDGWVETLHPHPTVVKEVEAGIDWLELTPIKAMGLVPFFAIASWMLFRKKYNFIEHIYITAFATIQRQIIFFVLISIPSVFIDLDKNDLLRLSLYLCTMFIILALTYWDYKQIFNRARWDTFWRVMMIYILTVVVISVVFIVFITFISAIFGSFKLLIEELSS